MIFPDIVIKNLIRIGRRAIISFPNFAYWKVRKDFLISGLMPRNKILPYEWYNTQIFIYVLVTILEFFV